MLKTIYRIIFILFIALNFGCNNEIEIAAEWTEIPIIYGLIDCNSEDHYIRIQRAYLDEKESALKFTNIPDSLYFDSLRVQLIEYTNNRESAKWEMTKVNGNEIGLPKDEGLFSNDLNYLYFLKHALKLSPLTFNVRYGIHVTDLKSEKYWTATLTAPGETKMILPLSAGFSQLFFDSTENNNIIFRYTEGKNTAAYSGQITFNITEMQKSDTSKKEFKVLKWNVFESQKTVGAAFNNESRVTRPTAALFRFLAANLDEDQNIIRRIEGVDVLLYALDDEFVTFLNVNKPSLSIVQKKPEYTNIERGGFGIFASRTLTGISGAPISERGMAALNANVFTAGLNFFQ